MGLFKKSHKYWVVNTGNKDAISAVKKLIQGQNEKANIIELTRDEYLSISDPNACRYIRDEK